MLDVDDGLKHWSTVNLHTAATVEQEGLETRVAQLSAAWLREACRAIKFGLGCEAHCRQRLAYWGQTDACVPA